MKTLFIGDCHGDDEYVAHAVDTAKSLGAERVFALGDFGFYFVKDRTDRIRDLDFPIWWIDGNHEDFDLMREYGFDPYLRWPVEDGNLTYIPRGYVWKEDGLTYGAMGGGFSIDKEFRLSPKEARSMSAHPSGRKYVATWWPEEEISEPQIERVTSKHLHKGSIDVMLCHDAPVLSGSLEAHCNGNGFDLPYKIDEGSAQHRAQLKRVWDHWQPSLTIHGHYHYGYESVTDSNSIIKGLNANISFFQVDDDWYHLHDPEHHRS